MTPPSQLPWWSVILAVITTALVVSAFSLVGRYLISPLTSNSEPLREAARDFESPWVYHFSTPGILHESAEPNQSSSPYWWLDSGGKLIVESGIGSTLQGELGTEDLWRERYLRSNAEDTDNGAHPQNIFRLISRSSWEQVRVEASFRIREFNHTDSKNRNESNGIFLLSRYKDSNNLYYAGLRVDGHAVIKKKVDGVYTTLSEKSLTPGTYSRESPAVLLPADEWLTIRMETQTVGNAVQLRLMLKNDSNGWDEVLFVEDTQSPHWGSYPIGIRTDFMDVEFDDVRVEKME